MSEGKEKLVEGYRETNWSEILDRDIIEFLTKKHIFDFYSKNHYFYKNVHRELLYYFDDLKLRPELLQNKTALDLGSNTHFFDEYCKEKYNTNFVAIDDFLEQLGTKHPSGVVADARVLPFKNESFDLIISHASMPHVLTSQENIDGNFTPIEGTIRENLLQDVLNVFREAYRTLKTGGQIRMSTFSENEQLLHIENRRKNNLLPHITESTEHQFARIKLVKEALEMFEKESGAKCIFKDEERGGLIIIMK